MAATTGATPPSWACPNASRVPCSDKKDPFAYRAPSDTTTDTYPARSTPSLTRFMNFSRSKGISGNTITIGISVVGSDARPPAAAIQPAWRPITSMMNTLVDVSAMAATSKLASRVEIAMYLATEPNPGQQSVIGRSLSTVFGMWLTVISRFLSFACNASFRQVSAESPPPL